MYTKFGPEAKDGDYVLVVDFNYVGRNVNTFIAKVHSGKAYTGKTMTGNSSKYIHKLQAEVVISETIVPEETKKLIEDDVLLHNKSNQGEGI